MHKLLVGLISYKDIPYLRETLPVLEEIRKNLGAEAAVMDTARSEATREFFTTEYPGFHYLRSEGGNIGFGASYNEILRQFDGFDYFLLVTSDVLLDFGAVKKFLNEMDKDKDIAMCAGKLHCWDFENKFKSDKIDSLGICGAKKHYFYDRGQGEKDSGQYDDTLDDFFGLTGAVMLVRIASIKDLRGEAWRLFDDRMWMYKEDIDLSYGMRWLGKKIVMFPDVWGWHARTVAKGAAKPDYALRNSYKNHILMLKNNFSFGFGAAVLLKVLLYESAKAIYMLLSHPSIFFEGMKTLIFVKGRRSRRLVGPWTIMSYFD